MSQAESFDILTAQRRLFESGLRPLERLVALAIVDFYSATSPSPFPSVNLLAQRTGLDRKAVMRAIDGLNVAGAIRVVDGKKGTANRYLLGGLMTLPAGKGREVAQCATSGEPAKEQPRPPTAPAQAVPRKDRSLTGTSPPQVPVPPKDQSLSVPTTGPSGGLELVPLGDPKDPIEGTQKKEPKIRARARGRSPQVSLLAEETSEGTAHGKVVERYFQCFATEHGGERPTFDGEDGRAVKTLLKKAGSAERACEFIDRAFQSFRRSSVTIKQIARDPDGFTAEARGRQAAVAPQSMNDRALAAADEAEARADELARSGKNLARIVRIDDARVANSSRT